MLLLAGLCRGEARFTAEWLAYHFLLGFDQICLGCNDPAGSKEYVGTLQIARRFGPRAHFLDWPDRRVRFRQRPPRIQLQFYDSILARYREQAAWVAFLDLDEYLVAADLPGLLAAHDDNDEVAGFLPHWRVFGSAGLERLTSLHISTFTQHAPWTASVSGKVKSVLKPRLIKRMHNAHEPVVRAGSRMLPLTSWSPLAVNHYFCRGRGDFAGKVLMGHSQGCVRRDARRRWNLFAKYDAAAVEVDTTLVAHAAAVKAAIKATRRGR